LVELLKHDGVTEWRFSSVLSRATGYTASAFLTDDGVLIDSGIPAARADFQALIERSTIRGAMLTHHHEDHAGNAELLAARGIPLWIAPTTMPRIATIPRIRAYRRFTWFSMPPLRSTVRPFDEPPFVPVPTPGHTPDHHVFWDAATRTVYGGDLFLGVAVRVCHHDEDLHQTIASLERVAELEPERLFDSHRGLVPDAAAALRAKANWTREIIERIAKRISDGESDSQILKREMGGESTTGWASRGEYSRRNFVRSVRRGIRERQTVQPTHG
jgi:glyoxylase-like metal-dependent hydrolase (beta-lactamase superfamily II)